MRVRLVIVLACLLLPNHPAGAATWESYERLPGSPPLRVRVRDQERTYFRLTSEKPLVVPVDGPGRMRVITRVEMSSGNAGVVRYDVRATEGTALLEQLSTESSEASEVGLVGGGMHLGKSRRMTFDVPAG